MSLNRRFISCLLALTMAAGLLALTAGADTLRLLPPLVITQKELDRGLEIMGRVMGA